MDKKILISLMIGTMCVVGLSGCHMPEPSQEEIRKNEVKQDKEKFSKENLGFEVIDDSFHGSIVYDKKTKVMYYYESYRQYGTTLTPLYNADGTLRIYEENKN